MALTDSLISYWKLDEASGSRADSHGSNTLTDNLSVGSGTGLVYGTVADFEIDTQNWLSRADNSDLSGGVGKSFTVAAWVKFESLGQNIGVLGKGLNGSGFEYMLFFNNGTERFRFRVTSATAEADATLVDQGGGAGGGAAPTTGTWYLVIVDHDAPNDLIGIASSVDGISTKYTAAYSADVWDSTGDFNIGRTSSYFPSYCDGLIGPVMFWTRVLTSQERTDLYNGGAGLTYAAFAGGAAGTAPYAAIPPQMGVRRIA